MKAHAELIVWGVSVLLLVVAIGVGSPMDLSAQSVYSTINDPGNSLVAIDPGTGQIEKITLTGVSNGWWGTFDRIGHRIFFGSGNLGTQQMVTVDLDTLMVNVVPIPASSYYRFFEYDPRTDRVLSASLAEGRPVMAIDPVTGSVDVLVNTGSLNPWGGTLDVDGNRLFIGVGTTATHELIVLDLDTLNFNSTPILTPYACLFLRYDPQSDSVLSVTSETGSPLIVIDQVTGAVKYLTDTNKDFIWAHTLDPVAHRLFLGSGSRGEQELTTVDLGSMTMSTTSIANDDLYSFFVFGGPQRQLAEAIPTLTTGGTLFLIVLLAVVGMALSKTLWLKH